MTNVAAVQMNSGDDIDKNLQLTRELVCEAKQGQADFVVLPECFALMASSHAQRLACAQQEKRLRVIERFLSKLALNEQIWILAAGIFTHSQHSSKIRNTSYLFDGSGTLVDCYDKIHLFDVTLANGERYDESRYTEAGSRIVACQSPLGTVGITVCYDVRFPNLYQTLAKKGAVVFAVPSAFSYTTGKDHWEILLRARAVENHAYVIAPAQWGTHSNLRKTYGHTMIVDPWGKVLDCKKEGNGVVFGDVDAKFATKIRNRFNPSSHMDSPPVAKFDACH